VRARPDFGDQTQRNARGRQTGIKFRARAADGVFDQLDLVDRIDVDRVDAGAHGLIKFLVRLARAVKDDLIGTKAGSQGFEQFAAAVDLDVDARVAHHAQHGHVRICFGRVAELDRAIDLFRGGLQASDVAENARL
jgi:hypothetical protein